MSTSNPTRPLAIVTGASTGIGRELARLAAEDGYKLVIAADRGPLEEAAAEFRMLGANVDVGAYAQILGGVKVGDGAGLVPQIDGLGKATVIFATIDAGQFSTGTCMPGSTHLVTTAVAALASGSARVSLVDPRVPPVAVPLEAGRYAVVITSIAKQIWRIPNELQPALLDAGALLATPGPTRSLLQTQQVSLNLMP